MGGKRPERAGGQEGTGLGAARCTIRDIVAGVCCALCGDGKGSLTGGWELLWSVLHPVRRDVTASRARPGAGEMPGWKEQSAI